MSHDFKMDPRINPSLYDNKPDLFMKKDSIKAPKDSYRALKNSFKNIDLKKKKSSKYVKSKGIKQAIDQVKNGHNLYSHRGESIKYNSVYETLSPESSK